MTKISDIATAGKNSFGLIRLLAAIAVIFSHAYIIVGSMATLQPLEGLTGYPLGAHAVHVFFTISGLLVAASLDRQPNIMAFVAARFFRIYPGLIVATLLVFICLVIFVSDAPLSEIMARAPRDYFAKILVILTGSSTIAGVFETMPLKGEVNVPIWTLKYEVVCYITLIVTVFLVRRTKLMSALQASLFIMALSGAWMLRGLSYNDAHIVDHIARFSFSFWAGACAWHLRDRIPVRLDIAVGLLTMMVAALYFHALVLPHLLIIATGYAALYVGQFRYGIFSTFTDRNDLSYGVYVYGWPIEQTLLLHNPSLTAIPLALIALALVLPIGFLSWRLIEKPALRWKDRFA